MANDDEWVSNVKRWCLGQAAARPEPVLAPSAGNPSTLDDHLGYEAAHPALQARHWPDAAAC